MQSYTADIYRNDTTFFRFCTETFHNLLTSVKSTGKINTITVFLYINQGQERTYEKNMDYRCRRPHRYCPSGTEGVEYQLLPTDIHEVDITKIDEVTQFVYVNRPDVIINCAGMTDVAECEKNIDEAYRVNAIGVRNVALAANDIDAKVIQISTDDVFDKESRIPYNEFDTVHPRTIYGKSKEAGEKILTQLLNRFVIIRSSWIYGIGRDFVDEVLRNAAKGGTMEVPNNQYAAPTSAFELARVICHFIDNEEYGLYHVVCPGSCSRYEFARTILEYTGKTGDLDLYPVVARDDVRPTYSVLDNMMLRLTGIPEPLDWKTALKEYLEETGGIE